MADLFADRESSGTFTLRLEGDGCEATGAVLGVEPSDVADSVVRLLQRQRWSPGDTEESDESARRQVGALIQRLASGDDLRSLVDPSARPSMIQAGYQLYSIAVGPASRENTALSVFTLAAIVGLFIVRAKADRHAR